MTSLANFRSLGLVLVVTAAGITSAAFAQSQPVDVAAAEQVLLDNKCAKCHSVDKQKDGPSFMKTAAKHRGKPDAIAKLVTHLSTAPTIEIDGVKEAHQKTKAKDEAALKNLAAYILSR